MHIKYIQLLIYKISGFFSQYKCPLIKTGKEGKIYVYRLNDFEGEVLDKVTRGKAECRENRIEKTKGIGR